jgi:putative acetyltransferase
LTVEQADPRGSAARMLLEAHAADMAARYPAGGWAGVEGRKEMLWLAWDGDAPVGVVALRELGPELVEVKHLYVVPEARRRGVGGALMDEFEAEAARRGATIVLETGTAQPEAITLYEARGYDRRGHYEGSDVDDPCSVYFELAAPGP